MSFTRPNVYEFRAEGHTRFEERFVFRMEFTPHGDGEGSVVITGERVTPERWKSGKLVPEKREEKGRTEFSTTYQIVEDEERRMQKEWWLLRTLILALARGDVSGRSASDMAWAVFWHVIVLPREEWAVKAAPKWWKLIDPLSRAKSVG